MADHVVGNKSEELAQAEKGANFEAVNRSIVSQGDTLRIKLEEADGELSLTPLERAAKSLATRGISLQSTADHQLMSQLVEEPEALEFTHPVVGKVWTSNSRMARIQSRNRNREELVWYAITPRLQMAALDLPLNSNSRIVIKRDSMEGEYSCRDCAGKGYQSDEPCGQCDGDMSDENGVPCPSCVVLGYGRESKTSSGHRPCNSCHGVGWRGGIVIPEVAQNMPVTGIVVSLGPNALFCKLGDRVLHSKYAGHNLDTSEKEHYTIMRESEVLGVIRDAPTTV